jgi:hypothetical protein
LLASGQVVMPTNRPPAAAMVSVVEHTACVREIGSHAARDTGTQRICAWSNLLLDSSQLVSPRSRYRVTQRRLLSRTGFSDPPLRSQLFEHQWQNWTRVQLYVQRCRSIRYHPNSPLERARTFSTTRSRAVMA